MGQVARAVAPYPWQTLERLGRDAVRGAAVARRRVQRAVHAEGFALALGEIVGAEIRVVLGAPTLVRVEPDEDCVVLELPDAGVALLRIDPELATLALARVLGRSPPLVASAGSLGPTLTGALAALLVEAARRSGAREPMRLAAATAAIGSPAVRYDATVLVDGRPYRARADVALPRATTPEDPPRLEDAGELPVALRLIVAESSADPSELASLSRGDAWLPGEGFFIDARQMGPAVLAAPGSERGLAVDLAADGSVVVGDRSVALTRELESDMSNEDASQVLKEAVLDAPVVVHVELGSVSLTAREWAALQPGDVIETSRRINEPVSLRVAGREVARGELVEIEGELGVRIREILSAGGAR